MARGSLARPLALHERTDELAALTQALERVADGHGAALLIEGPAGIGKTTVLDAARAAAAERGLPVLAVRGTELERTHAFGGARRMLAPAVAPVDERAFAGPAEAALIKGSDPSPGGEGHRRAGCGRKSGPHQWGHGAGRSP
jgi:putative protein kinase ArgK-like GTPase of G3E family